MNVKEWLGENNKLGIDIWTKKYQFENETFDEWLDRISNGNEDVKKLIRYSCSRNLERPVPETKEYSRRTMRQVFNHDLVPKKGFYIDKNSIKRGINAFTGMGYLYYQEIKLKREQRADPVKIYECPICHQFTLDSIKCDCQTKRNGKHISRKYNKGPAKRRRKSDVACGVRKG